MKTILLSVFIGLSICFSACKKNEGTGGAATIKGSILGKKYNGIGVLIAEYPMAKEDVFIIYGNSNSYFDDKIETSYDGSFEFRNLQPGNYTVFCYSKSPNSPSGDTTIIMDVNISNKKDTKDLGVIEVRD